MAQKPVPHSTTTAEYVPGEVLQADINVFAGSCKAGKHLREFGNHVGALTELIWLLATTLVRLLNLMLHWKYS